MKNGLYRNYLFGGVYKVIGMAKGDDGSEQVIYHPEAADSDLRVMSAAKFDEMVELHPGSDEKTKRFSYLEPVKKVIGGKIVDLEKS